jgi:nucleoside-diphosphate-sugar epimerase
MSNPQERQRILIAGCGYVGTALATELAAAGHEVFALRRSNKPLPGGVAAVQADLTDSASLAQLPQSLDAVVYAAAADGSTEEAYRSAYVTGLGNLLKALQEQVAPPSRAIFTSSTGVYAQDDGEWVDETSPAEAAKYTGAVMREAEECLWASGLRGVSLRLGGIYGPGRTRLIESVAKGNAVTVIDRTRYANHQHRGDCAGALHHLLCLPDPAPCYIGVDCEPAERGAMLDWIADELGVARPRRVHPDEAPQFRGGNKRCSNKLLVDSGYVFRYPTYREGYGSLLDEVRQGL